MPPPPPRKPAPPVSVASKERPTKPERKRETFIGNDSATMMTEETFAEFEARMKREEEEDLGEDEEALDEEDSSDDSDDEEADAPQQLGPGGRPLDRFGVEWDYVSHEGMGFNDDEDEDAMTFEKNGKTYFKPDWGKLRPSEWVKYWQVNFALEAAQGEDDEDVYQAALEQHGFRNRNHWKRVQHTFLRHYAEDPEFTNAALEARQAGTRDAMKNAVKPGMLDPIEGVSLQVYASHRGPADVRHRACVREAAGAAQARRGEVRARVRAVDGAHGGPERPDGLGRDHDGVRQGLRRRAASGQYGASAQEASSVAWASTTRSRGRTRRARAAR